MCRIVWKVRNEFQNYAQIRAPTFQNSKWNVRYCATVVVTEISLRFVINTGGLLFVSTVGISTALQDTLGKPEVMRAAQYRTHKQDTLLHNRCKWLGHVLCFTQNCSAQPVKVKVHLLCSFNIRACVVSIGDVSVQVQFHYTCRCLFGASQVTNSVHLRLLAPGLLS